MSPYDEDELTGGEWRPSGGIMRWFPTLTSVPEPEPPELDVHTLIACPSCHARVTQTCRTRSGHRTNPHKSRLAPRLCACGASVGPRRRYCDECSAEATRVSKRDHLRRRRAASQETAA